MLGSKNLVERTIIFAKKLVENNCIILSTDSDKILKIGNNLGILDSLEKTQTLVIGSLKDFRHRLACNELV